MFSCALSVSVSVGVHVQPSSVCRARAPALAPRPRHLTGLMATATTRLGFTTRPRARRNDWEEELEEELLYGSFDDYGDEDDDLGGAPPPKSIKKARKPKGPKVTKFQDYEGIDEKLTTAGSAGKKKSRREKSAWVDDVGVDPRSEVDVYSTNDPWEGV